VPNYNWGNSASVSGLSDENVEIFLETFLQVHPANRSLAALVIPASLRVAAQAGPEPGSGRSLTGEGARERGRSDRPGSSCAMEPRWPGIPAAWIETLGIDRIRIAVLRPFILCALCDSAVLFP